MEKLLNVLKLDVIKSPSINLGTLALDAAIALILEILGVALTYLVQVFLARWMGVTEYGIYEYVISWSVLLSVPVGLGLPNTVLRLISEYRLRQEWGLLRGLVLGSWLVTFLVGLLLALGASTTILIVNHYHPFTYAIPLSIGILMMLLRALGNLQLDTFRALKDIVFACAPVKILWPFLVLCGGFVLMERHQNLTAISITILSTLMLLSVIVFQLGFLLQKLNQECELSSPIYTYREWLKISLPLLLQGVLVIVLNKTDIIMIGSFVSPEAAGVYTAASRTAIWVKFFLGSVNLVVAPTFVTLYSQKDIKSLQKVVSTVALWIFVPSCTVAFILIVFSQFVMGMFGSDFVSDHWELKILVLGHFVNALSGSVGYLMTMTGHQNQSARVFTWGAIINLVLNPIFIFWLGPVGAAIITTFTLILCKVWLTILVIKNVGVYPDVFYPLLSSLRTRLSSQA